MGIKNQFRFHVLYVWDFLQRFISVIIFFVIILRIKINE